MAVDGPILGNGDVGVGLAAANGFSKVPGGKEALEEALSAFAREGLRTLVLAQRDLKDREAKAFLEQWHAAETAAGAGVDRAALLAAAAASVERDLEIVGATAIEDRLQDGVRGGVGFFLTLVIP